MPAIGYSRYQSVTTALYDKKGLSHYLLRVPTSRYILPLVNFVRDKQIVEVGIGTGYYSKFFQKNRNKITGVDVNPHLCPPEFSVVEASASDFARHITTPHDMIVSFWMTEYLNREELFSFLRESRSVLAQQSGAIFFTIIGYGIGGWFYTTLAWKLRKVVKYMYSEVEVLEMMDELGYSDIRVFPVRLWLGIPFAYVFEARIA